MLGWLGMHLLLRRIAVPEFGFYERVSRRVLVLRVLHVVEGFIDLTVGVLFVNYFALRRIDTGGIVRHVIIESGVGVLG